MPEKMLDIEELALRWHLDSLKETRYIAWYVLPRKLIGMTMIPDSRPSVVAAAEAKFAFLGQTVDSLLAQRRERLAAAND